MFSTVLGKVVHRPAFMPIPSLAAKLLLGGEKAEQMLLNSSRIRPMRLLDAGFEYKHLTLEEAFRAELD
ncbi:MAG: DUF1731 domain-containing protein [Verrucomicrobiota bacterium]